MRRTHVYTSACTCLNLFDVLVAELKKGSDARASFPKCVRSSGQGGIDFDGRQRLLKRAFCHRENTCFYSRNGQPLTRGFTVVVQIHLWCRSVASRWLNMVTM